MAKKAAWDKTKEENQKTGKATPRHSSNQKAFFSHMHGFRKARAVWNATKKRPASASSAAAPAAKRAAKPAAKPAAPAAKTTKKKRKYTKLD